ncbi:MAG: cobalt-precorrin-5B (C(1))-methyltransferase [Desulfamplus sp.]|nr:cobalt-precorrin-5B (C(1))-methyltransferase [Desulfamplus sp.]
MNSKEDRYSRKKENLRQGFTTGTAAAAAAKAALLHLVYSKPVEKVEIKFLTGSSILINVDSVKKISDNCAEAIVIKDAGDDPDVTHKAEIGARVFLYYHHTDSDSPILINIRGGEGVGIVTKPGLEVMPGNPAINSGPETMIREAVNSVLGRNSEIKTIFQNRCQLSDKSQSPLKYKMVVDVEIFVPKGRELAEKTLNARLGIIGGISILGTTGIVKPMSHDAYIATIKSGISVARAMGSDTLVFTTGRRSERVAISLFPELPEYAFVQIGDFFQASLEAILLSPVIESVGDNTGKIKTDKNNKRDKSNIAINSKDIKTVIIVVFFGKAVKMAMGFPHTHAAKSELTMKTLAKWAENLTEESHLILNKSSQHDNSFNVEKSLLSAKIASSNTARHAFTYIYPDYPQLIDYVGKKIVQSADKFAKAAGNCTMKIRSIILDFDGNKIFDSALNSEKNSNKNIFKSNKETL